MNSGLHYTSHHPSFGYTEKTAEDQVDEKAAGKSLRVHRSTFFLLLLLVF